MARIKVIESYEDYSASYSGDIISFKNNSSLVMKARVQNNGYLLICLTMKGVQKYLSVHRLVAKAFVPNPKNKPQVNHIDGNKLNNRASNLEWVTSSENQLHASKLGLFRDQRGLKNSQCKLTNAKVVKIRKLFTTGKYTKKYLSSMYNVSPGLISHIILRRVWAHI